MKKTIITIVCLLSFTLTAVAQDIVGIWTTGENYNAGEKSLVSFYYTFSNSGHATLFMSNRYANDNPLLASVGDVRIYAELQGRYFIEGGKGLTINFDRSTAKVSVDYIPKAGMDAQTVSNNKAKLNERIMQMKDMIVAVMPLSLLTQITYFNGNCMTLHNKNNEVNNYTRVESIKK